jgi:predicted DNA-binding transcriptional regulator YafY
LLLSKYMHRSTPAQKITTSPIEFDGARRGYYYAGPTFRLPLAQMSQCEMLALYLSERMMQQFRGTPFEEGLRQAIVRLGEMTHDDTADALGPELNAGPWHLQGR